MPFHPVTDLNCTSVIRHASTHKSWLEQSGHAQSKLVFTQVMERPPQHTFRRCVRCYNGDRHVKKFSCQDQFRSMSFVPLAYRESLRDIEACLKAQQNKLYHMGIHSSVAHSTLAEANEKRDWRIYATSHSR